MQRALPSKRKVGSMVSIRNAGDAVYLKLKIRVSFLACMSWGNPPPLLLGLDSNRGCLLYWSS